jgi:hypothetical protein
MKTCVLISGLPRNVDNAFNSINECLIKPNNADVFIHSWIDEHNDLSNRILQLYNPVKFLFENQKKFVNDSLDLTRMMLSHGRSYTREKFVEMIYSSWYSNQQSNTLKECYRLENNVTYDYIIRARFDITYSKPIICSEYDPNILHIANRHHLPNEMIDDRFAFSSNKIMNLYCNGFSLIEYIHSLRHNLDGIFCGETMVYEMVKFYNLNHYIINDLHLNRLP